MMQSQTPWEYLQWMAQKAMELWMKGDADEEEKKWSVPSELEDLISKFKRDDEVDGAANHAGLDENDLQVNDEDMIMYLTKYRGIVSGIISLLSSYGYAKEEYYQKLWEAFSHLISQDNPTANGAILYAFLQDSRTPYCEVGPGMRMSDDEYRKVLVKIQPQTDKIRFIFNVDSSQKTETASRILSAMNELKSTKDKTVFLCQVIEYVRENDRR